MLDSQGLLLLGVGGTVVVGGEDGVAGRRVIQGGVA